SPGRAMSAAGAPARWEIQLGSRLLLGPAVASPRADPAGRRTRRPRRAPAPRRAAGSLLHGFRLEGRAGGLELGEVDVGDLERVLGGRPAVGDQVLEVGLAHAGVAHTLGRRGGDRVLELEVTPVIEDRLLLGLVLGALGLQIGALGRIEAA